MFVALRALVKRWLYPALPVTEEAPAAERAAEAFQTSKEEGSQLQDGDDHPPSHQAVPYDATLLEKVRQQWRRGEWESLVCLDMDIIEPHPDRAKLSLIVGSAWLQRGDEWAARRYLHHALEWGCDKRLAARILVSGVHNTLGRAAVIAGDEARIERHFQQAVIGGGRIGKAYFERKRFETSRLNGNTVSYSMIHRKNSEGEDENRRAAPKT